MRGKVVFGESVGEAFRFAQLGEADAALVALSLAIADGVHHRAVDASLYPPIIQAVAIVSDNQHEDEARRFVEFLLGPEAQAVFAGFGFLAPPGG